MSRVRLIAALVGCALLAASAPLFAGGPVTLDEALELAAKENKLVLIDFWAVWCGPCKAYNKDLEENAEIQDATARFILFKTDGEREGKELGETFSLSVFPTYVALNAEGQTLTSWAGYSREMFLAETGAVLSDPTTIEEKLGRFEANPNVKDALTLATYHDARGEYPDAIEFYKKVDKLDQDADHSWEVFSSTYYGVHDKIFTVDDLLAASDRFFNSEKADEMSLLAGARKLSSAAAKAGKPEAATPYLKIAVERTEASKDENVVEYRASVLPSYALLVEKDVEKAIEYKKASLGEGWMENPDWLNSFAWWCFENDVNLKEAYDMAKKGVELSEPGPDRAMILDTQAEICNAMNDCQQAVDIIRMAIQDDPAKELYKKQEKRFLELLAAKDGDKM